MKNVNEVRLSSFKGRVEPARGGGGYRRDRVPNSIADNCSQEL